MPHQKGDVTIKSKYFFQRFILQMQI